MKKDNLLTKEEIEKLDHIYLKGYCENKESPKIPIKNRRRLTKLREKKK